MNSVLVFLQIGGSVALLLFGLALVRSGVTIAFGLRLKTALGLGTRTQPRAFLSGLVATLGLQSSTATAMLTASFVGQGLVMPASAQIVLLGANVGTALTALILSSGIEAVAPALLLIGVIAGRGKSPVLAGSGRGLIGLGLMLISLTLLNEATEPLRASREMVAFLVMLDASWLVALIFGALVALACSSSLAAVLLVLSLDVPAALAVVLVLGANIGGALAPVVMTAAAGVEARRLTIGNVVIRTIGCLIALPFAPALAAAVPGLVPGSAGLAVEAHLAFNIILAALIWPFAGLIARLLVRLIPDPVEDRDAAPRWLDEANLENASLALAGASREALSIGDDIARMLDQTRLAFRKNDRAPLAEVAKLEDRVDLRQAQVKTYLSRLGRDAEEEDRRRSIAILDYVINLEHVGDIIQKGLAAGVAKKIGLGLRFSDAGYHELDTMFLMTRETLVLAQSIFMTRDRELAMQLMEQKVEIRNFERQSAQRHLMRLRDGHGASLDTSSLHLDILRDLKRINAHFAAVAHPILYEEGLLAESRIRTR